MILCNGGRNAITHCVCCPSNISACNKFVYIVQDGHENCVTEVNLSDNSQYCILEEEDGIADPSCVSVNRHGTMIVGMNKPDPDARGFQIDYDVQ